MSSGNEHENGFIFEEKVLRARTFGNIYTRGALVAKIYCTFWEVKGSD